MIAVALVFFVACGSSARRHGAADQQLDQLLAPIALYPDQLLAQMLMSATDPKKVAELDRWLKANQKLKGLTAERGRESGVRTEFRRPAVFPQVVARMADQIAWTTLLGQSFTTDEAPCSTAFSAFGSKRGTWAP